MDNASSSKQASNGSFRWIDNYIQKHSTGKTREEQDIILSWRKHLVKDTFYVMKHLKKYSVFMSGGTENDVRLYGILGLNQPFSELIDKERLPVVAKAAILPFKGQIVFDGLVTSYSVRLGTGMRSELNHLYSIAKARHGIIESLPFDSSVLRPAQSKAAAPKQKQAKDIKFDTIADIIHQFHRENLNEEFLEVSLHVLKKLSRKRPSPLDYGKPGTWACGIVYAVAANNFVFDRAQPYYMTAQDIADEFGLSKGTAQNQAAKIKKMLNISYFSPEYVIASLRDVEGSLVNMRRLYEDAMRQFRFK